MQFDETIGNQKKTCTFVVIISLLTASFQSKVWVDESWSLMLFQASFQNFLNTYRLLQSQNEGLPKSAKLLSLQLQARLQRNICMLVNQSLIQINQNRKLCIWKKKVSVIFQWRVIEQEKGICFDKNLSAAIQSAVVEQLGSAVFDQSQEHFFDHYLSTEADHLTTLLRFVTEKYVLLCLKTHSKRFTEMVVHKNEPSLRHRLTKTILFKNQ